MRAKGDLHKNVIVDLFLRAESGRLKSLLYLHIIPKFTLILYGNEQLEILGKELNKGPVRLFLDATGDITEKINDYKLLHHGLKP